MEEHDDYIDPENKEEILNRIQSAPTLGDVKTILDEIYPNWLLVICPNFSKDYPHLTENHKIVCDRIGTVPKAIILVDYYERNADHIILNNIAELLTRSGFVIRRKFEFFPCETCGNALPTQRVYKGFLKNKLTIPNVWNTKCVGC